MLRRRPAPAPPTAPAPAARPASRPVVAVPEGARRLVVVVLDSLRYALEQVDGVVDRLYRLVPRNTWLVVTSDHGELFGEEGYFGHGPIAHEKVFEVPLVEGLVP